MRVLFEVNSQYLEVAWSLRNREEEPVLLDRNESCVLLIVLSLGDDEPTWQIQVNKPFFVKLGNVYMLRGEVTCYERDPKAETHYDATAIRLKDLNEVNELLGTKTRKE